jgi:hypothetical protein
MITPPLRSQSFTLKRDAQRSIPLGSSSSEVQRKQHHGASRTSEPSGKHPRLAPTTRYLGLLFAGKPQIAIQIDLTLAKGSGSYLISVPPIISVPTSHRNRAHGYTFVHSATDKDVRPGSSQDPFSSPQIRSLRSKSRYSETAPVLGN